MSSARREENRQVALILTNTLGTNVVYPTGVVLTDSTPMHVAIVDGNGDQITSLGGLVTVPFNYIGVTYPDTSTEVYTYKTGGSGGTTVGTITLVYSDAVTKAILVSVTKS
jgi:hypothetical protein